MTTKSFLRLSNPIQLMMYILMDILCATIDVTVYWKFAVSTMLL